MPSSTGSEQEQQAPISQPPNPPAGQDDTRSSDLMPLPSSSSQERSRLEHNEPNAASGNESGSLDLMPLPSSSQERPPLTPHPRSAAFSELDLSSPLHYGTPSSLSATGASVGRGTPIRQRVDIRSERRIRQVNFGNSEDDLKFGIECRSPYLEK